MDTSGISIKPLMVMPKRVSTLPGANWSGFAYPLGAGREAGSRKRSLSVVNKYFEFEFYAGGSGFSGFIGVA